MVGTLQRCPSVGKGLPEGLQSSSLVGSKLRRRSPQLCKDLSDLLVRPVARIFILEDQLVRMRRFKQELIGHEVHHAETVEQAISMFMSNPDQFYDFAFLDHDLGGEEMVDPAERNTGSEFVRQMRDSLNLRKPLVILHSHNPSGASEMRGMLEPPCFVAPFGQIDWHNLRDMIGEVSDDGESGD